MIHVLMGKKGSGKTTKSFQVIKNRLFDLQEKKIYPAVLIHDTRMRTAKGWNQGCVGLMAPNEARYKNTSEIKIENNRLKYRVNAFYECDADEVSMIAWQRSRHGLSTIVVIDEIDSLPERLFAHRDFTYKCIHWGRPYPIDLIGTTRMPQRIDASWYSQADYVTCFNLSWDLSLKRIEKSGWPQADQLAKILPKLKPYQYVEVKV